MESVFIALLLIASLALGVTWLVFWAMRQVGAERGARAGREEGADELEESVAALIERLTTTTDECLARLDAERRRIEALIGMVAPSVEAVADAPSPPPPVAAYLETGAAEVYRLADDHVEEGEIAQRTGVSRDEVRLMLALRAARG